MKRLVKYSNENANAKPMPIKGNNTGVAANPLHDSTNMVTNLLSKNPLLDTPASIKDMPRDQNENNIEPPAPLSKRGVLQPLPIPTQPISSIPQSLAGSAAASKYSTPNKTPQNNDASSVATKTRDKTGNIAPTTQPNPSSALHPQGNAKKTRKPYDEDLVNFDQSPSKRMNSRGRTPSGALERAINSGLSSAKRSESGDDFAVNITPRSKLNQMRNDRREDKPSEDYEKCDQKLKEVEQELKNIQIQPNFNTGCAQMTKTSNQMKESLIRLRSAGNTVQTKGVIAIPASNNTSTTMAQQIVPQHAMTYHTMVQPNTGITPAMHGGWVMPEPAPVLKPPQPTHGYMEAAKKLVAAQPNLPVIDAPMVKQQAIKPTTTELPLHGIKNENMMQMMANQETVCEKETEEIKAKIEEEESKLTLEQRLVCKTWQVRRHAYKEIADKFEQAAKDNLNHSNKENLLPEKGKSMGESCGGSIFQAYFSWLKYMLSDINLNSLHQGLTTIFVYTMTSPNVTPALGLLPDLLDKMPLFKPQFQDIVTKIIHEFVKRDHGNEVMTELLGRFTSHKSIKVTQFCINTITGMLNSTSLYEEIDLKQIYMTSMQGLMSQNQRDLRIPIMKLLAAIFELVVDSVEAFVSQVPEGMKVTLVKELTDGLRNIKKRSEKLRLFPEAPIGTGKEAGNANGTGTTGNAPKQGDNEKKAANGKRKLVPGAHHQNTHSVAQAEEEVEQKERNLYDCIPEEIFKVMYLTKSEEKKAKVEELNASLEKLLKAKAKIEKKDHSNLINVLCNLLDDNNLFVQTEILKAFQNLCLLLHKDIGVNKGKLIINKIAEKFKENKTGLMLQIEITMKNLIRFEAVTIDQFIETMMLKISTTKNPRIRQMSLQVITNKISNPQEEADMKQKFIISVGKIFSTHIAQKLVTVILKDTNANVRDAGIALLTQIKLRCPSLREVDTIISKLPKARMQAIYAEVREETQKTPREQVAALHELRRSKSEMNIVAIPEPETAIKQDANDGKKLLSHSEEENDEDSAEKAEGMERFHKLALNKKTEDDILSLVPNDYKPSIRALYKLAEGESLADFVRELKTIKEGIKNACRSEIIFCLIYALTTGDRTICTIGNYLNGDLIEEYFAAVMNIIKIASRPLSESELSCALSCGIFFGAVINETARNSVENTLSSNRFAVMNHLFKVCADPELFMITLQKVLYTFKYSNHSGTSANTSPAKDSTLLQQGMAAYKVFCEWLQCDEMIEELVARNASGITSSAGNSITAQKLLELLDIENSVGFTEEFIAFMKKCKSSILDKMGKRQVYEAIANASAVIKNLKVPTPRSQHKPPMLTPKRMSKNQQLLQSILESINQKDPEKIKKGLEQFHTMLDELINASAIKGNTANSSVCVGILYTPFSLLQDLLEGTCLLIARAQYLEDSILKALEKLRKVITLEEATKLMKTLMQRLADYLSPDHDKKRFLNYYRVLNCWGNEIAKKELTSIISEIFSGCSFRYDSDSSRMTIQLRSFLHWVSTQILGNLFEQKDIEPIIPYIIRGLRGTESLKKECESLIKMCYQLFGQKEAQMWLEKLLMTSQNLYKIYGSWYDTNCVNQVEEAKQVLDNHDSAVTKKSPSGSKGYLGDLSAIDPKNMSFESHNNSMMVVTTPSKETPQKPNKENNEAASNSKKKETQPENNSNKKLRSSLMKEALIGKSNECSPEGQQASPAEDEVQGEEPLKVENLEEKKGGNEGKIAEKGECRQFTTINDVKPAADKITEVSSPRFGSQECAGIFKNGKKESAIKVEGASDDDNEESVDSSEKEKVRNILGSCLKGDKSEKSIAQLQAMLIMKSLTTRKNNSSNLLLDVFKDYLLPATSTENPKKALSFPEKLMLIKLFNDILSNDDILQSCPIQNIKPLCHFCLHLCAEEKILMTAGKQVSLKDIICASNDVISELQSCLTKIVNSHSFTLILSMLIDLLRDNLPEDFSKELKQNEIILFRLLLICMQRTYKAAMTTDPGAGVCASQTLQSGALNIRTYAILLQLYQLFVCHPPEKLKLNLPSLQVFDLIYKILRELTDDLIGRDVDKAIAFLKWVDNTSENKNTFVKYLGTIIAKFAKERSQEENN